MRQRGYWIFFSSALQHIGMCLIYGKTDYRTIGERFFVLDYQIADYVSFFQITYFHKAFAVDKIRMTIGSYDAVAVFKQHFASCSVLQPLDSGYFLGVFRSCDFIAYLKLSSQYPIVVG